MFQITPTTHLADDEEEEVKEKQKQGKTQEYSISRLGHCRHPMISSGTAMNLVRFCNKGIGKFRM